MPLVILGANSVSGGYEIDNSLRYNSGSSDRLTRTLSTGTSNTIGTISLWVKRSILSATKCIFGVNQNGDNFFNIQFGNSSDQLNIRLYDDGSPDANYNTTAVFRDVSAWYHVVIAFDTTQATSANRIKVYVNNTLHSLSGYPPQNQTMYTGTSGVTMGVGESSFSSSYYDGYLSEYYFIDGQQLTPSSFGETDEDTGIWKPKAYTGTYGTNGFYLQFKNSASLGTDSSGNGNTFTVNNLTSIDQTTDTPTNNFCTLNRLMVTTQGGTFATISEGATKWTSTSNETSQNATGSTIGVDKGKWYWEVKWEGSYDTVFGIVKSDINMNAQVNGGLQTIAGFYGINTNQSATGGSGMRFVDNGTPTGSNGSSVSSGNIIMFALDCDNSRLYVGRNGTWENSGVPASGTGFVMSPASSTTYIPAIANFGYSYANNGTFNFGNPAYTGGSYTDGAGFGNFSYAVPSGYFSLNTKNLANFGF